MAPSRARRALIVPLVTTIALLTARAAAAPPISDPTGAPLPPGLHLEVPPLYLALGPLFSLWDGISMLSMTRLRGFLVGMALLYLAWRVATAFRRRRMGGSILRRVAREVAVLALAFAGFALFVAAGLLWHRPMIALAGAPDDAIVADFHSHTNVSHDVRNTAMRDWDVAASRRWHGQAGFDAFFVTDHNTVAGLRKAVPDGTPAACPGIEVSAWRAHVVLLGDTVDVDRKRYNGSLDSLLGLLRSSESDYGALSVASIPEYERNHWGRLDTLIAAGLDGFEVVNAAPKANELTRTRRDSVIALARAANRFVVGVSDHHGWGATSMVWNLVSAPGWRAAPDRVCGEVLSALQAGFPAVRVVERHRLQPDSAWPAWLTPVAVVWETWRGMGTALVASWLAWIWGVWLGRATRRRKA